jgi:hypothetical protein
MLARAMAKIHYPELKIHYPELDLSELQPR